MFHANIEAGIEHVSNIGNTNYQKFPLAFRAGQFVDEHFIETYYGSHQSQTLWLSLTVIRVMYTCTTYINITMLPENGEPAYRIYVWRIPTIKYGYAV